MLANQVINIQSQKPLGLCSINQIIEKTDNPSEIQKTKEQGRGEENVKLHESCQK